MDDRLDRVLQRLEAIERRLAQLESRAPTPPPPPARSCAFAGDERRVVDLVVSLTAERVEDRIRALMREEERREARDHHRRERHPDGRHREDRHRDDPRRDDRRRD